MDWFLYDNGLHHERVKSFQNCIISKLRSITLDSICYNKLVTPPKKISLFQFQKMGLAHEINIPSQHCWFKVNNWNTRPLHQISSKLTWTHQNEVIDVIVLLLSLLTLVKQMPAGIQKIWSNAIIRDKGIERYSSYLCYTQKFTSW